MQFPGNKGVWRRIQEYILSVSPLLCTAQVRLSSNNVARKCLLSHSLSFYMFLRPSFPFTLIHLGTLYTLSLFLPPN